MELNKTNIHFGRLKIQLFQGILLNFVFKNKIWRVTPCWKAKKSLFNCFKKQNMTRGKKIALHF